MIKSYLIIILLLKDLINLKVVLNYLSILIKFNIQDIEINQLKFFNKNYD